MKHLPLPRVKSFARSIQNASQRISLRRNRRNRCLRVYRLAGIVPNVAAAAATFAAGKVAISTGQSSA
jgi:hypothetical protein